MDSSTRTWRWSFNAAVVGTLTVLSLAAMVGVSLDGQIALALILAAVISVTWGWVRLPWAAAPRRLLADPVQRRAWLRSTAVVAAATIVVGSAIALALAYAGVIGQPTFTCSTTDVRACLDTKASILSDPRQVFGAPLVGRLVSVDVRSIPSDWDGAVISDSDWGALLTIEGRDPVLVACYYSSDDMVSCAVPGTLIQR